MHTYSGTSVRLFKNRCTGSLARVKFGLIFFNEYKGNNSCGSVDFKFKNNNSFDIRIVASSDENYVYIDIVKI